MQLMFLGTGAMVPTKERNVSCVLLEYDGEFILFDCGEGTQRQMNLAGFNRTKVRKVLLTHWHGDHVSGLIGLIQTIGNVPTPGRLTVVGPKGTKERMHHLVNSAIFDARLDLDVQEIDPVKPEVVLSSDKYDLLAAPVEHSVPTVAYAFVERDTRRIDLEKAASLGIKPGPLLGRLQRGQAVEHAGRRVTPEMLTYLQRGRKVVYVMDTSLTEMAIRLAEEADVLICESTFSADQHQEKAEEYGHLSARDAAQIARAANARQLVLTHFSQRYVSSTPLLEEAQDTFPNTIAAFDFMQLEVARR
jgi:ribonuclease Z